MLESAARTNEVLFRQIGNVGKIGSADLCSWRPYQLAARNESFNSLPYQHNSRCVVRYLGRRDLFLPGMAGCDYPAASFKSLPYRLQLLMGGLEACHGGEGRRRP